MNTYNLSNIKTFNARNGYGMVATLLINEKPIAVMDDRGDGSEPFFDIIDIDAFAKLECDIAALPEMYVAEADCELEIDLSMFVCLLHYALETKTPFTLLN